MRVAGDDASVLHFVDPVAGIGDELPGIGKIISLEQGGTQICCPPPAATGFPLCGANNNEHGQIAFAPTVQSGTSVMGVLLVATPTGAPQ